MKIILHPGIDLNTIIVVVRDYTGNTGFLNLGFIFATPETGKKIKPRILQIIIDSLETLEQLRHLIYSGSY